MRATIMWIRDHVAALQQKLKGLWSERLRVPGRHEYGGENVDSDPPDMGGIL